MKILKTNISILLLLLCVLLGSLLTYYITVAVGYKKHYFNNRLDLIICNDWVEKYKNRFNAQLLSEGLTLRNDYLRTTDNDTVAFYQIMDNNKLIYRFFQESCQACVEDDLKYLKELGNTIGYENIIIISSYEELRLLKTLKIERSIISPCYSYSGYLVLPLENDALKKQPYFFLLDEEFTVTFPYVSGDEDLKRGYFSRIRDIFYSQNQSDKYPINP